MGIYENIKKAAESRGKSINLIEQNLSLPRSSIAKYNTHIPSADKILNIAHYLNVSMEQLMTGKEPEQKSRTNLTFEEESIITAYRALEENQKALVCQMLGIKRDSVSLKEA